MKTSTDLFKVVKSLNKQEKRYLKLYFLSNSSRTTNYSKLFDVIEKQKEYNEFEIKKIFHGEKFLQQLNVTKQNLYKLVLKGLRNYQAQTSLRSKIFNGIENTEILYNKGLYELAESELAKTKALAYKGEVYFSLPPILHFQKTMFHKLDQANQTFAKSLKTTNEFYDVSKLLQNDIDYWTLHNRIFLQLRDTRFSAHGSIKPMYKEIVSSPLFKYNKGLSNDAKKNYFISKIFLFLLTKQYLKAIPHYKRYLSFLEKRSAAYKLRNEPEYWTHLSNLLICYIDTLLPKDFFNFLEKLKPIPVKHESSKLTKWYCETCLSFLMYAKVGEFEKAQPLIPLIDKDKAAYVKYFSAQNMQGILYEIAFQYFKKGEFSKCIKRINSLLHDLELKPVREDMGRYSLVLLAFSHLEKQNYEVCAGFLADLTAYKGKLFETERIFLLYLKESLKNKAQNDKNAFYDRYKKEYLKALRHENDKTIVNYFDFERYLDQKMNK